MAVMLKRGIIYPDYQDEYVKNRFGNDYDWSFDNEEWTTITVNDILFYDGDGGAMKTIFVGIPKETDKDEINPYDNENGEIFRELCKCYAEKNNLDWYGDREGCINAMLDSLKENEDDN
jgi:hypothetical protein